ncbi:MAG: Tm-1-like ATP-binding domain-containing protein [Verrucomicrobiota bacterium]
MATIAILGTMDTKGVEHAYVADCIGRRNHQTLVIDVGTLGEPRLRPDITRAEVAAAAGVEVAALAAQRDRGAAVTAMSRGAPVILARLAAAGRVDGVISLGGGGGTAIATAAMRVLPVGFPKVMVSTLASGDTAPYVGGKDIVMFPSIVDIAGLNRLSRLILSRAAGAICGMVEAALPATPDKPIIVASQFGNTTPCVDLARQILEDAGHEVLVFAAVGTGGRTMESLIESGMVAGVLDLTTTELADELVGGVLTAGPNRLEAAARHGVPAVVSTGCLDMVNFREANTVPSQFHNRRFYAHNPQVTLMRTDVRENQQLGCILARKLSLSKGPVTVVLPLRGGSMISAPGQPFHDPQADRALYEALKANLRPDIPVVELDCAINDPPFAATCAQELLRHLDGARGCIKLLA